jgi:hypothetical protein
MTASTATDPAASERRLRMTYEEYLAWADEDTRAERVDGEDIVFTTVKGRHALIVGLLFELIRRPAVSSTG